MLDEQEYAYLRGLDKKCDVLLGDYISEHGGHRPEAKVEEEMFRPMLDEFERLSGRRDLDPKAIIQHRLAKYGPP